MDDQLADLFEQCLERVAGGASVDECLAAHPAAQAELELPLRMATQLSALPRPAMPAPARAALEASMLRLAAERRAAQAPADDAGASAPKPQPSRWRTDPGIALLALLRALGYRGASAQPWLRPAALALLVLLALLLSAGAVVAANAVFNSMRAKPAAAPAAPTATAALLDGPIEHLAQERWQVGGRSILIGPRTAIRGTPRPGALAHVRGVVLPNGALLAESVEVETPAATVEPTAAVPSATPARPAPTRVPTSAPAAVATALATPAPTTPQRPAAPQPRPAATQPPSQGGNGQICQGRQLGRDDKKCDPKPHAGPPPATKPPADKHDDKKKDGNGRHK